MQWQRAVRSRLYSEWAREGHCINPFTLVHLSNLILLYHFTPLATVGDQIVDTCTLSMNEVYSFREQSNPHPHPPLSPPFKVGVSVVFYK